MASRPVERGRGGDDDLSPRKPYAEPRIVTDLAECRFYHTLELPGVGVVQGDWDLRAAPEKYLGNVQLAGKRVIDVGTASGFITFYMESQGADVVAYDLSHEHPWDVVPYARTDVAAFAAERREMMRRINNSWWFAHRAYGSNAKVAYGTVYDIPAAIGPVDVSTFGMILLHLRDPFLALENAARLTRETIVVTEGWSLPGLVASLPNQVRPGMAFRPDARRCEPRESWWALTPGLIKRFLAVLGFERSRVAYHAHRYQGRRRILYSVVASRTAGVASAVE